MYHYKQCGLDNVYLLNGFDVIETSEGKATSIHHLDDLHCAIANQLIHLTRPLTGKEFRFLRIEMDMSQKALSHFMDKSDQTIALWEKGKQEIPKLADVTMRQLYAESNGKDSKLRSFFDAINELDRNDQENEMRFQENETGWHAAA